MAFTPNRGGIRQMFSVSGEVGRYMERLAQRVEQTAKRNVGVSSGELRDSGEHDVRQETSGVVAAIRFTTPYALYHHEGTRPHDIGSAVLIRDVGWRYIGRSPSGRGKRHPGTRANPFLEEALETEIRRG